jgi:hypothetical protein
MDAILITGLLGIDPSEPFVLELSSGSTRVGAAPRNRPRDRAARGLVRRVAAVTRARLAPLPTMRSRCSSSS